MKGLKQQDALDTVKIVTGGIGYYTEHTAAYIITRKRKRKEERAKKTNYGPRNRFRDGGGPYRRSMGKNMIHFFASTLTDRCATSGGIADRPTIGSAPVTSLNQVNRNRLTDGDAPVAVAVTAAAAMVIPFMML